MDLNLIKLDKPPQLTLKPGFSRDSFTTDCSVQRLQNFSIYEELRISKKDFLAGFLSQLAQGKPIDECVRCGHYAANHVIQQSGVTLTDLPSFS